MNKLNDGDVMKHQIPMTQELFEQCIAYCAQIEAYDQLSCFLNEYPEFSNEYVRKREEKLSEVNLPGLSEKREKEMLENIHKEIKKRRGEK